MQLNTRCPACETVFPVSLEQLQLRKGYIRCAQCAHIFDGFEAAVPTEPARQADAPARQPAAVEPVIPPPSAMPAAPGPEERPAHQGFIIPPPERFHVDSPQPARPFSIGNDQAPATEKVQPSEPSISPATQTTETGAEPRAPSVFRARDDMRGGPAVAGPSFTISDPRARQAGRQEPGMTGGATAAGISSPQPGYVPVDEAYSEAEDTPLFIEAQAARRSGRHEPEFLGRAQRRQGWLQPVWLVLILCGVLLLAGQGIYVYRAQLANNIPALRPTLEAACASLGCSVPYDRHIEAIAITGSALRSSGPPEGEVSNLTLEVTLRNTHERPQEWPTLVLDLKDASGTIVVRRNLDPGIWVPAELREGPFAADTELRIHLPVSVRGVQANGYQLDKFFP